MPDIYRVRRENLRLLLNDRSATAIADACGYSGPSYVSQMAGRNATRPITETTARKMEKALTLPEMWLDQPRNALGYTLGYVAPGEKSPPPVGPLVDPELLMRCIGIVEAAAGKSKTPVSSEKKKQMIYMVYEELPAKDSDLQKFADRLVTLAG